MEFVFLIWYDRKKLGEMLSVSYLLFPPLYQTNFIQSPSYRLLFKNIY